MGKKRNRKPQRKPSAPPLTRLDKFLYVLGGAIAVTASGLSFLLLIFVQSRIAFASPTAVASREGAGFLLSLPFILLIEISAITLLIVGWQTRKPLFGSKKINYGTYPQSADCVPLFRAKGYRQPPSPAKQRLRNRFIAAWCVICLLFACLVPFGLFGRTTLTEDNRIETVNLVNQITKTYTPQDFSHLTLKAFYTHAGKYASRDYLMTVEMKDGKRFTFSQSDFRGAGAEVHTVALDKMLEIKALFDPWNVTVENAYWVDQLAEYYDLDTQQTGKLQRLFSE